MTAILDDTHRFIYQHIASVEQLEVLLLARRSRGRSWHRLMESRRSLGKNVVRV